MTGSFSSPGNIYHSKTQIFKEEVSWPSNFFLYVIETLIAQKTRTIVTEISTIIFNSKQISLESR